MLPFTKPRCISREPSKLKYVRAVMGANRRTPNWLSRAGRTLPTWKKLRAEKMLLLWLQKALPRMVLGLPGEDKWMDPTGALPYSAP